MIIKIVAVLLGQSFPNIPFRHLKTFCLQKKFLNFFSKHFSDS
jgi:hypothetical protein